MRLRRRSARGCRTWRGHGRRRRHSSCGRPGRFDRGRLTSLQSVPVDHDCRRAARSQTGQPGGPPDAHRPLPSVRPGSPPKWRTTPQSHLVPLLRSGRRRTDPTGLERIAIGCSSACTVDSQVRTAWLPSAGRRNLLAPRGGGGDPARSAGPPDRPPKIGQLPRVARARARSAPSPHQDSRARQDECPRSCRSLSGAALSHDRRRRCPRCVDHPRSRPTSSVAARGRRVRSFCMPTVFLLKATLRRTLPRTRVRWPVG